MLTYHCKDSPEMSYHESLHMIVGRQTLKLWRQFRPLASPESKDFGPSYTTETQVP